MKKILIASLIALSFSATADNDLMSVNTKIIVGTASSTGTPTQPPEDTFPTGQQMYLSAINPINCATSSTYTMFAGKMAELTICNDRYYKSVPEGYTGETIYESNETTSHIMKKLYLNGELIYTAKHKKSGAMEYENLYKSGCSFTVGTLKNVIKYEYDSSWYGTTIPSHIQRYTVSFDTNECFK
ncbi:hypothetical protein [Vibrio parahaemolyticus]|uniref:hypothetical protein n=1 Tax=Vibrio parahaemolyticus TaxID=670 RepID=UPI000E327E38|nr:hypothetical protein [Vibrio parahaemolyticus]MCI4893833.1 hypothetical protein [Vibrio parahaemolyticus]MEA5356658.1 hypothetical protein [Vibrio parahaemolyticus]RFD37532.1 hypothetical protein BS585_16400 [Vibrio parahaemolyticus]